MWKSCEFVPDITAIVFLIFQGHLTLKIQTLNKTRLQTNIFYFIYIN